MSNAPITCDTEFDPNARRVDEALAEILQQVTPLSGYEKVTLHQALGRVLQQDIVAPGDVPPHRNSAMDGYALRSADLSVDAAASLTVVGRSMAGHPFHATLQPGECVRIMTGAVMPDGADSVVMQEQVQREGDLARFAAGCRGGQNIRHPGEDMRRGDVVLRKGRRLCPSDVGLLASLGLAEVRVTPRPRVAFFSTGDELKAPGERLGPGEIYDSNRFILFSLLSRMGVEPLDLGVLPDQRDAVRNGFAAAMRSADMIITSGGVSVGEADFVTAMLREMGQVNFYKIAMKPGRPLTFGKLGETLFFGLPGNPVSAMATFHIFVRHAITALSGEPWQKPLMLRARLASPIKKAPGRADYQRGILRMNDNGEAEVITTGMQASHILRSMSQANCFIVIPLESGDVAAGEWVDVMPL